MEAAAIDLEEHASVDDPVVPPNPGQVDLRFDPEAGLRDPPHEQALDADRAGP